MKSMFKIICCALILLTGVWTAACYLFASQSLSRELDAQTNLAVLQYEASVAKAEHVLTTLRMKYNTEPDQSTVLSALPDLLLYDADGNHLHDSAPDTLSSLPKGEYRQIHTENELLVWGQLSSGWYLLVKRDMRAYTVMQNQASASLTRNGILWIFGCAVVLTGVGVWLSLPQRRLKRGLEQVEAGSYGQPIGACEFSEEFNRMTTAVSQNVTELSAAAQAQQDFVANFSHELKTPLTSIIGYADLMRSAELDGEDAFIAASYIFSEGKRLESLSLKLMDMMVLDKQEFALRPLPASKLLEHIAITVRPMLSTADLSLELRAAASRVEGERDLLITLIMNLLDNARKASEHGSKVVLTGKVEEDRYRITVTDFGTGIPKEELNRITEAFYMVDKSRSRAMHGAGLGLALAQHIAVLHGSQLTFESEVGVGTTASFTLKRLPKSKEMV